MALQTEVWASDILGKLFPDDSFVTQSVDDTAWVNNKKVHSPEEGEEPEVEIDGVTVPMTMGTRTDVDNEWTMRTYRTKPILIEDTDAIEVSYDKRSSVLRQHVNVLNKNIANMMSYDWAPTNAANIIRTTGASRSAIATNFGATGNRKKLLVDQFLTLQSLFNDMDVPQEGRNVLLPSFMYDDLIAANWATLVNLQSTGESLIQNGALMRLFSFKIWIRGGKNILTYTNAGTPVKRLPKATALTTANAAALAWHKDWVKRAKGGVTVYANEQDALAQGDIFSARVRAGGRIASNDQTGVIAIVEDAA